MPRSSDTRHGVVPGRVSIIVPCYNQAHWLREAVDSALEQTYDDVEVVVVDDGSTDGTSDVVRQEFGDRVVLVTQPNRGLQRARNVGIAASSGEFIMLLDSDDRLSRTAVATRMTHMRQGVGAVAGYYREIDLAGDLMPRIPQVRSIRPRGQLYQVVRRNYGPPVAWLFRREALDRCGAFDPALTSCDDWDVLVRVAAQYEIAYDAEVGGYYRQVPGSMSRQHLVMYDMADAMLAKNQRLADSTLAYRVAAEFGRFQHRRRILYACLTEGSWRERGDTLRAVVSARPALIPVGALSFLTLVAGKRPSSRPPTEGALT